MPTLKDLLDTHLAKRRITPRALADQTGISYPTLLALVDAGEVPPKAEQREALRQALGLDHETWAKAMAASGEGDGEEPPTLQRLVVQALQRTGHTEQSLAKESGIAYPTLLGIARKGAIPRNDTLIRLADALGLVQDEVFAAAEASKGQRRGEFAAAPATSAPAPLARPEAPAARAVLPSLATQVAAAARRQNLSLGVFARMHDLPYLSLARLVATGVPPTDDEIHGRLAAALGLTAEQFALSLAQSTTQPEPAQMDADANDQGTPLQTALRAVMERKGMTMKAFAELSELSVLTATRLVKHGALPSRATTHQKLRLLLDLPESEYDLLLRRSQPSGERASTAALAAGSVVAAIGADDEFQHRETEEITPHGEVREALAPRKATTAMHNAPPPDDELAELIARLNPRQKHALHQFLLSVL